MQHQERSPAAERQAKHRDGLASRLDRIERRLEAMRGELAAALAPARKSAAAQHTKELRPWSGQ